MKPIITLTIAALLCSPAFAQDNTAGLSPVTRQYLAAVKAAGNARPEGFLYRMGVDGKEYISALIKVSGNAGLVAENLATLGVHIGTKAGDIWTVDIPVAQTEAFTRVKGIAYIELDEPVITPKLDMAKRTTRVDSVHKGINLPMVYSGKNVVVGVIDFGFDYNHPTFYDTSGTGIRIKKVWELGGIGAPPAGELFGRELADTSIIKLSTTDNALQTHGTAVAGMAAGSGYGSSASKWRGMAYDAEMVMVGVRRDSIGGQWRSGTFTDFIRGVDYIFKYAATAGKPAVINISWGSQSGPHDGTTLFNQACNNLSGAGKLIVMSAGNEGEEHIHLAKTFTPADTVISSYLTFTPATYKRTWVDVWGNAGNSFSGKAVLYRNGAPYAATPIVPLDNNIHSHYIIGSNGTDTCFVEYINSIATFNGKPRMTMSIFNKTSDTLRVEVSGRNGSINMWNEYYYYGYDQGFSSAFSKLGDPTATEGDTLMTVSDMGAATSVLLVGAYASKVSFPNIINSSPIPSYASYIGPNKLVPFSSRGPLADGRIKPDITAPGLTIATSMSSYDTAYTATGSRNTYVRSSYAFPLTGRTYYYAEFTGTSAASPAAAGIVALMLQVNPQLTPQQAQAVIYETAIQDSYTGVLPAAGNNGWGHGKINAYAAVKRLVQTQGIYNYTGNKLDCVLFPNPSSNEFTLDYTGSAAEELAVELVDINGRVTARYNWQVAPGQNLRSFKTTSFARGTYLVQVMGKQGKMSIKTVLN